MNTGAFPRVLAIVLNWQQPETTLACVRALQAMRPAPDILVIDNGSTDASLPILREHQNGFRLLALDANTGFAAGNNEGLLLAIAERYGYALLVNNDAFAAPDMLANLLRETAADIALLSPKIVYEADPQRIWFANGRRHPLTLDLRDTGRDQPDGPNWSGSRDVDYLLGTCLLVNLAAARIVGLLDQRFFFYFEDLDWCLRFSQAGYRLRLVGSARLTHRVALSTGGEEDSALRRYHLAYGSVLFWRKHASLGNPAVIVAFRLLSAIKMVTRLLLERKASVARAYWRGLRDGWRAGRMN